MLPSILLFITLVSSCVASFQPIKGRTYSSDDNDIWDDPLILTSLLKEGKYKKAQHLSKVKPDIGNITSYSGFFTVNEKCESNLFFWFFPAQKEKWEDAPLVLWLQGGPGSTSMYGLFEELGPFESYKEGLRSRQYSWNVENNLLFIDQPVGVGYSFTKKKCYPQNETAVGADLYEAVVQFHQLFPSFQKNKFLITGESYAGHYIPALGYAIYKNNPSAKVKVNLVTMMIGDGWVDPVTQVDYGSYLYQLGFIDDDAKGVYKSYQDQFVQQVQSQDWSNASDTCDALTGSLYTQFVGDEVSVYNFLPQPSAEQQNWDKFIQSSKIRKALHVGKLHFQWGDKVYQSLKYDIVQSVKPWVEELLEVYPIIFYNGEVDIICAYPMTINFLRSLSWSGEAQYLNATRTQWCVGNPKQETIFNVDNEILEDPLFLTPLLKKGKYKKAQDLSKVKLDIGNITSYSGFFTVNEKCGSNLFFWFFPAQKEKWEDAPLALWLQGPPGSSSLQGLFEQVGPFESYEEGLRERFYSWNVENNLLFIDQPVGVGYSFTTKKCYPQNETAVGADLYEAVVQFHQLFPSFQKSRFFITGQSYGGHYIPALGYTIYKNNPSAKVKVNLVTMMIGDGWVDPVTQVDYGSYLYQLGFIDDKAKEVFDTFHNQFVKQIESQDWSDASDTCDALTGSLFTEFVGNNVSLLNFLPQPPKENQNWEKFIQSPQIREALHVGKLSFQWANEDVSTSLKYDIVQSVKPWVKELLEVYPIVFYNGEVDIICAYPMTVKLLRSLSWSGEAQYLNATRTKWCVEDDLAGYYKGTHNLYDVLVRDAGHMVPADQSLWAYILVNSVTSGPPDNPLHALTAC